TLLVVAEHPRFSLALFDEWPIVTLAQNPPQGSRWFWVFFFLSRLLVGQHKSPTLGLTQTVVCHVLHSGCVDTSISESDAQSPHRSFGNHVASWPAVSCLGVRQAPRLRHR